MLRGMSALNAISQPAREVLLEALMSVAWADRTLADEERKAAQAAAMSLGLVLPGERDLASPDRTPIPPEQLAVDALNTRDRELVFLCAAWMAFADEVEDPSETQILDRLQRRFELTEERVKWLKERAHELRDEQAPDASWWRAFDKLVVEAAKALQGPA